MNSMLSLQAAKPNVESVLHLIDNYCLSDRKITCDDKCGLFENKLTAFLFFVSNQIELICIIIAAKWRLVFYPTY
jgi:hypothetical protein